MRALLSPRALARLAEYARDGERYEAVTMRLLDEVQHLTAEVRRSERDRVLLEAEVERLEREVAALSPCEPGSALTAVQRLGIERARRIYEGGR